MNDSLWFFYIIHGKKSHQYSMAMSEMAKKSPTTQGSFHLKKLLHTSSNQIRVFISSDIWNSEKWPYIFVERIYESSHNER